MVKQIISIEEEVNNAFKKGELDEKTAIIIDKVYGKQINVDFPTPKNNYCFILRSRGTIGWIPISRKIILRIHPKISIGNLFKMLEFVYNLPSFKILDGHIQVESVEDLIENLAAILAKNVLDRIRKGLYLDYLREEQELPFVRGRIKIIPTLLNIIQGSLKFECMYGHHTADLEDNQILVWTLYVISRLELQREDVRYLVRHAYRMLAGAVTVKKIDTIKCLKRVYHRLNSDYRPMHGLCWFFLEHCGPGLEIGPHDFIPFLLNMPSLFEAFVAKWIQVNLPRGLWLDIQYKKPIDELGTLTFQIDLVLVDVQTNQVLAVLDTKYKRTEKPERADIHQIVTYAESLRTQNAILIYPSTITQERSFPVGKIKVRTLVFDIDLEPEETGKLFIEKLKDIISKDNIK